MELYDKVEKVAVDELIPYYNNPKEHPEEQVDKIASSIKHYGFTQPIVISDDNEIIIGHGRVQAGKKLGLEEVPAIVRDDLTDAEMRALRIADNKVAESGWDMERLSAELEALDVEELELGFEVGAVEEILEDEMEQSIYTDKVSSPQYKPIGYEPEIVDLMDTERFESLLKKVEDSEVEEKEKEFLRMACYRHVIFNYEEIAEYYCHADSEMQELMEDLALVIIDFEKAIEQGFAEFNENVLGKRAEEEAGDNDEG